MLERTRPVRERAPGSRFLLWLAPWIALLAWGVYAAARCLVIGLNQTNMDNRYAFGLWIFLDLTVIALGAGAFFTGFLLYIMRRKELEAVIATAVVVGFSCYSGALAVLAIDVGQPLRFWFTFWHPNVHSMLTEVTFCITCYLGVLAIEYAPLVLEHRRLRAKPSLFVFERELHKLMGVFAAVGTVLSFFHQGSLGGLYGVLRGRPFAFREGLSIWPSTFFLFALSAVAVGPVFLLAISRFVEWMHGKPLVPAVTYDFMARLSGWLLAAYVGVKSLDTLVWLNRTTPSLGAHGYHFYSSAPFGTWILFSELVVFGLVPALILLSPRSRRSAAWQLTAALGAAFGIGLNRFVITVQTLALPTLSFDETWTYTPSWQEVASFLAVVAYGVLLYSISHRYLRLFPFEGRLHSSK